MLFQQSSVLVFAKELPHGRWEHRGENLALVLRTAQGRCPGAGVEPSGDASSTSPPLAGQGLRLRRLTLSRKMAGVDMSWPG
jgi:hypothetical protein